MLKDGSKHRVEQVSDLLRCELSSIMLLEVRDPRLQGVTVTQVRLSPDLKEARVYYDWMGSAESRADVERALRKSAAYIRRSLAKKIEMKQVPHLQFHFDETREFYDKATRLLGETESQK